MSRHRSRNAPNFSAHSLCRSICVWAVLIHGGVTLPQAATDGSDEPTAHATTQLALIPSAPDPTGFAPPEPVHSTKPFPTGLIPSAPRPPNNLISSQPSESLLVPTQPPGTFLIPSQAEPPSSLPPASSNPPFLIPSEPPITNLPPAISNVPNPTLSNTASTKPPVVSNGSTIAVPSMISTGEGLHPIPAPSTNPGDPDGHHEIPEPNFSATATAPCRGCSPIVQIPATGWGDNLLPSSLPTSSQAADAEPQETPDRLPQATITAGPSTIVIKPEPTNDDSSGGGGGGGGDGGGGGFIIGDLTTIQPGRTITMNKTPVVIQTTSSRTELVLGGTQTVTFQVSAQPGITEPPLQLLPVTIGSQTLTPIVNTDPKARQSTPTLYVVAGQTLIPGGAPITISGTTFSLPASPTAVIVNGQTSTIAPNYGNIVTKTTIPYLTLFHTTYTANAAGNYVIGSGATLRPGGEAITVSGTVLSLKPGNTEVVVQGSTSFMAPVTTVVTLTRSAASDFAGGSQQVGTAAATLPYPAGARRAVDRGGNGVVESVFALGVLVVGWFAGRL